MNIGHKDDFAEFRRNFVERRKHVFIFDLFRNRWFVSQCFLKRLIALMDRFVREPFPPVMMNLIEQDLKEPCLAIRAWLEAMKRFPGLKVDILDKILSVNFCPAPDALPYDKDR